MSSRPLRRSPAPHAAPPASIILMTLVAFLALITGSVTAASFPSGPAEPFRVLVYSGGAHASLDTVRAGVDAVRTLGALNGFGVEATDDPDVFDDDRLARFHAIVFNGAAPAPQDQDQEGGREGGGLDAQARAALRTYIRAGGGWVGLHGAAAGAHDWDWYEGLVGATVDRATPVQTGRVEVLDHAHPSTVTLPDLWERTEEWYNWRTDPAGTVHTLAGIRMRDGIAGLDEGADHPWSWCQDYDGGRSWFTAGGSAAQDFRDGAFLSHLLGGIEWAAGAKPGGCTATRTGSFQRTPLAASGLTDPVDVAVASDRRVFVAQRTGQLKVVDQRTMKVSTALDLAYAPGMAGRTDGLTGLALDPDFAENNWLYLLRSESRRAGTPRPGTPRSESLRSDTPSPGTAGYRLALSRFTADGDTVDPASEKRLLTLPVRRTAAGSGPRPQGRWRSTGPGACTWEREASACRRPRARRTMPRARSCGSRRRTTAPTPCRRAIASIRARPVPVRRSTRRAFGPPTASPWTRRTARCWPRATAPTGRSSTSGSPRRGASADRTARGHLPWSGGLRTAGQRRRHHRAPGDRPGVRLRPGEPLPHQVPRVLRREVADVRPGRRALRRTLLPADGPELLRSAVRSGRSR